MTDYHSDPELETAKSELMHAISKSLYYYGTSHEMRKIEELASIIDDYIDLKIAIALEMLSSRIEDKIGVRP